MATTFKNFQSNDLANTRTLLHEAIPITGSIVSGTYADENVKTYGHGMFTSVYDYPFLSSSANQIFDTTVGVSADSNIHASVTSQKAKKLNIYNQMAQYLVGYDDAGSIKKFVIPEGNITMNDIFVIPFSRLLAKDEIKKGSFSLELGLSSSFVETGTTFNVRGKLIDFSGSDGYFVDSPAGEYGILYGTSSVIGTSNGVFAGETLGNSATMPAVGLIYYQAGIVVISGSAFNANAGGGALKNFSGGTGPGTMEFGTNFGTTGFDAVTGSTIDTMSTALRNRIFNISFNNTTELNSTIYFARASHTDFNYSSNPTYLSGSEIRVKVRPSDTPVAYFTTVGLYSADNELLAVAKLSEPLRKDPTNELTLRVRLDY
tara:strand:- start:658 stop:1779 length:1122 start_codon:yes stop_codon:yes gene_type:complete